MTKQQPKLDAVLDALGGPEKLQEMIEAIRGQTPPGGWRQVALAILIRTGVKVSHEGVRKWHRALSHDPERALDP